MSQERNYKWYVLKVAANLERKTKGLIENKLKFYNLSDFVESIIIPTEKKFVLVKKKKTIRESVMMPGYLFIHVDLTTNGEVLPLIEKTSGVFGFLSFKEGKISKHPIEMAESDVKKILELTDTVEEKEIVWNFNVGQEVKILDGAFKNFKGTIHDIKDKTTLTIMVSIFGRLTAVDLHYTHAEKI